MSASPPFRAAELWEPATRADPHGFYARVRAAGCPVRQVDPTGAPFAVVARHADVLAALHHPAIGHELHRHAPDLAPPRDPGRMGEVERINARQLIDLDPPDHTRLRRIVSPAFTTRRVARLEPWITSVVNRLVAGAGRAGTFDGVAQLADPLPVAVIADLVGVPEEDRPQFRAWSATIVSGDPESGPQATAEFAAFVDRLAARRRAQPEDDLLSVLLAREADGDGLDRDELVAMVQLLLIAGQETTVDLIANALRLLLAHPDEWQALRADPGRAALVVEEVLRFSGPVEIAPPRWAFADVPIGGGVIPAFHRVGISLWGANRDPEVFADPDAFAVDRADVHRHLAFGHGIHFCLGAGLARLEARVMLERLAQQLPALQLAPGATAASLAPNAPSLPLQA